LLRYSAKYTIEIIPINLGNIQPKETSQMKTSVIMAIAFLSLISSSVVSSARSQGTVISVSPSSSTLPKSQIGANYLINISISDVANLWSWKVRLNWNPGVLNFINITEGPFLKDFGATLFPPPPQRSGYLTEVSDTLLENASASGSGLLATVTFQVVGSGQSDITLTETELLQPITGQPPTHQQINNTVANGELVVLGSGEPLLLTLAILIVIVVVIILVVVLVARRHKPKHQYQRQFGHSP